ncbi:MAG: hypothetical protein V1735_01485 [Nanoarchaeota archaeon]
MPTLKEVIAARLERETLPAIIDDLRRRGFPWEQIQGAVSSIEPRQKKTSPWPRIILLALALAAAVSPTLLLHWDIGLSLGGLLLFATFFIGVFSLDVLTFDLMFLSLSDHGLSIARVANIVAAGWSATLLIIWTLRLTWGFLRFALILALCTLAFYLLVPLFMSSPFGDWKAVRLVSRSFALALLLALLGVVFGLVVLHALVGVL